MREAFEDVVQFHRAVGQMPLHDSPMVPGEQAVNRRLILLREEYVELVDAILADALAEIADGIADLVYVALGTAVEYGIDIVPVWNAVQSANMTKIIGPIRADGKREKPPGFKHPDVGAILSAQPPLAITYAEPRPTHP